MHGVKLKINLFKCTKECNFSKLLSNSYFMSQLFLNFINNSIYDKKNGTHFFMNPI